MSRDARVEEGRMRCCTCKREFKVRPGPGPRCPGCGSVWYEWLDYAEFALEPETQR